MARQLSACAFYDNYFGHPVGDLTVLHAHVRAAGRRVVWLAGDSSLDNKHWVGSPYARMLRSDAWLRLEGVARLPAACAGAFEPPALALRDVAYWVNAYLEEAGAHLAALNCAVEESTVRQCVDATRPHDAFVRAEMRRDDVLVVSIGGNDVVLAPTLGTLVTLALLRVSPACLEPLLFGAFRAIFKTLVERYVERLCSLERPRLVVVCAPYYPCVATEAASWADAFLRLAGYETPARLQRLVDRVFAECTSAITIEGTRVVPLALSTCLDFERPADYVQRVEPSAAGGAKIARRVVDIVLGA